MGTITIRGWKVVFYVTKFGNPCKNPPWEPKQSKLEGHMLCYQVWLFMLKSNGRKKERR